MNDPEEMIVELMPNNVYYICNTKGNTEYLFDADTFELIESMKVFNTDVLSYIPSWTEKIGCIDAIEAYERAKRA